MYNCNICGKEAIVDHINPAKLNCNCEGGKVVTSLEGALFGDSDFGEKVMNNNLSEASALILRNTLFAISANEFFLNEKESIEARDVRVKDSVTGKEFTFTLIGHRM